jgi:hypothetical protein
MKSRQAVCRKENVYPYPLKPGQKVLVSYSHVNLTAGPIAEAVDGHEKFLGEDYDTLVLIAAGSGVSYCLSNALDIVRRAKAMRSKSGDGSIAVATKRLSFIWVVKKPGKLRSFLARLGPIADR